jgi:replicative DNA helicase
MSERDTYLLEIRLLATALDTGTIYPQLSLEDLNYPDHRILYRQMLACREDLGGLSYTAFGDWLQSTVGVDLREWLASLSTEASTSPELMPSYIDKLHEVNASGELRRALERMPDMTADTPEELKREAIRALESVTTSAPIRKVRTVGSAIHGVLEEMDRRFGSDEIPGVPSGLPKLDEMTGGFQPGDLTILAARPAVGKTAMMLNFALHAARQGKRVGIFSAEQPIEQITQRLMSMHSRVPAWYLRNPKRLDDSHWKRVTATALALKGIPILVNDDSSPSVDRLMAYAQTMDVDIIFVDYIQRLKAPKTSTIYERVSAVALALKEMARECSVPVVALAQINRAGAQGARMENLKGSGDIEQEADSILILERKDDDDKQATLALEKNRHGPTGELALVFNASILEFLERMQPTQDSDYDY